MSEVLGLSHCKDYISVSARWATVEMFEQKSDTIFQWNPLQGSRIDWEADRSESLVRGYFHPLSQR